VTDTPDTHRDRNDSPLHPADLVKRASPRRQDAIGVVVSRLPRDRVLVRWPGEATARQVRTDYLVRCDD
jgi:hypothetical protein